MVRWHARVIYRTDGGPVDVEHDLEEIEDLHDLIELGPHWDTVERIEIARAVKSDLTIEEARRI